MKIPLPKIKDLLKMYDIKANKKQSQNFIMKSLMAKSFCDPIHGPFEDTLVVEIGVGPGAISRQLLKKNVQKIIGIESDHRFIPILEQLQDWSQSRFEFMMADALDDKNFQITQRILGSCNFPVTKVYIVGNLPFAVAGRLLSMWNKQCLLRKGLFATGNVEMILMFSKAVGDRLLPTYNKRTQFATITNTAFAVEQHMVFPKTTFFPQPNDDALALIFKQRQTQLFNDEAQVNSFLEFMRTIYKRPNKQASAVFGKLSDGLLLLQSVDIPATKRLFDIPIKSLVEMSKIYHASRNVI